VGGGMVGGEKGWATPLTDFTVIPTSFPGGSVGLPPTRPTDHNQKEPQKNLSRGGESVISLVHRSKPVDRVKAKTTDH
jgi:hypothetical protein